MDRLVIAVALCVAASSCSGDTASRTPRDDDGAFVPPVEVVEVIDGDSLRVDIDGEELEVRLLGVNAPELDECHGHDARKALAGLVDGASVTLDGELDAVDRFGRLLRYVFADRLLVNSQLVVDGHALATHDVHEMSEELLEWGDAAWRDRAGLWAPGACGPPGAGVAIGDVVANPPGDDAEDLSGEFVTIVSRAAEVVDLSGWILRDESSVHRFVFPTGTQLVPGRELQVVTGCEATDTALAWCSGGPVWSNGGDTAVLQTPEGSVVDRLGYGPEG